MALNLHRNQKEAQTATTKKEEETKKTKKRTKQNIKW